MQFRWLKTSVWLLGSLVAGQALGSSMSMPENPAKLRTQPMRVSDMPPEASGPQSVFGVAKPWRSMTAKERAKVWPKLSEMTQRLNWQSMTPTERKALRELLTDDDVKALRARYQLPEQVKQRIELEKGPMPAHELDQRDRALLRRQIMEIHIELKADQTRER